MGLVPALHYFSSLLGCCRSCCSASCCCQALRVGEEARGCYNSCSPIPKHKRFTDMPRAQNSKCIVAPSILIPPHVCLTSRVWFSELILQTSIRRGR